MILKKVEKDNNIRCVYESSNILASNYDLGTKKLSVVFKNGGKYTYLDVAKSDYLIFEMADSQGKILNSNIKQYTFVKDDDVDTKKYLETIENVKQADRKNLELGIIQRLKDIVNRFEEYQEFDSSGIEIGIKLFEKYKNG